MAVMDFRDGGFGFTRSRQRARRNEDFEQFGWDEQDAEDAPRDHRRFAANPSVEDLPSRLGRLTHYLGAVLSVGLMVGLLGWGWQLVMRDVSGVPVIAALQGEARTSPEEPGGELTGHTGLAVNDVAEGVARTPADEVAIAPETTGLDDSDVAMGALGATAREPLVDSETPLNFEGAPEIAMTNAQLAAAEEARAAAEAAALAVEAAQVSDAPAAEGAVTSAVTDENGQIAEPDAINEALAQAQRPIAAPEADTVATGSVQVSARPAPRPRRATVAAPVQTASATPAPAAASRPASRDEAVAPAAPAPAPAPVQTASAAGGPQVQIGAFDSDAIAASEWGRVSGKHGSLFSGKGQVIQKHESNGRTFWRLRVAGFGSRDEARQFCKALIDAGTDCIPAGQ